MNERDLIKALVGEREDLWNTSSYFRLTIQTMARGMISMREDVIIRSEDYLQQQNRQYEALRQTLVNPATEFNL